MSSSDFGTRLAACRPALMRVAYRLTRNKDMAEELVQDAMLRAWSRRGIYQEMGQFQAWCSRIVHTLWSDKLKRLKVERAYAEELTRSQHNWAMSEHAGPWRILVAEVLARLGKTSHRDTLLHAAWGYTWEEYAAHRRPIAEGTYRSSPNRGRAALAKEFDRVEV